MIKQEIKDELKKITQRLEELCKQIYAENPSDTEEINSVLFVIALGEPTDKKKVHDCSVQTITTGHSHTIREMVVAVINDVQS